MNTRGFSHGYARFFARWVSAAAGAAAVAAVVPGCGYRAVYASAPAHLHVKLVRALVTDVVAADEVTAGLREELARAGSLEAGDGFPRVEIEVLRETANSEGIGVVNGAPRARANGIGLTARAWVVRAEGAPAESDTGDLRAEETTTVDLTSLGQPDARSAAFHEADALRAAARQLGRKLALRIVGEPAASEGVALP